MTEQQDPVDAEFTETEAPAQNGGAEQKEQEQEKSTALVAAADNIPVGDRGAAPTNLGQQIDYARIMMKARASLPEHLRDNVGDCLAVVDIATRTGMSPYMLAGKTYVQNKRLCFESQAYHALAQGSGLLRGDLSVSYEGEGEELVCIVSGYIKGDPEQKVLRSEPLGKLRPKRNADGVVKGSPLWDRKPKVQMYYDTSRDWVRIYAPRATLGIYTPDEIDQYADDFAAAAKPDDGGLRERLQTHRAGSEGHKPAMIERELSNLNPQKRGVKKASAPKPAPEPEPKPEPKQEASKPRPRTERNATRAASPKPKGSAKEIADRAEKGRARVYDTGPKVGGDPLLDGKPKSPSEYIAHAERWIDAAESAADAFEKWAGEEDMRLALNVAIPARNALKARIQKRFD